MRLPTSQPVGLSPLEKVLATLDLAVILQSCTLSDTTAHMTYANGAGLRDNQYIMSLAASLFGSCS